MIDPDAVPLIFDYTNWRGEARTRHVLPQRVHYAATEHHPEPQWLLEAYDVDRDAVRQFAMKDMRPVGSHIQDVAQAAADRASRESHARDEYLIERLLEAVEGTAGAEEAADAVLEARERLGRSSV